MSYVYWKDRETVGQYLRRRGVKLPQGATAKEAFEAYCKAREEEAREVK